MSHRPEDRARQNIDRMLEDAGWVVQDRSHFNLSAGRGVAIRELSVKTGAADYALFVDEMPVGTVEAQKEGETLIGVEEQSMKYRIGLAQDFPDARYPLPFSYETTGIETRSKVEARLSIIAQTELEVEANLKRAERLRQTILAEAFVGRLVPQHPDDESASILLERIRQERKERDGMQKKGNAGNGRAIRVPDDQDPL